ncbi:MAG: AsmA family protein [Alphaproteobacteria bacterium]|nr:AsmA family protein [Alphaproteobacteria bacterium]
MEHITFEKEGRHTMRRIYVWILIFLGICFGALLVLPFFINVNNYKPEILTLARDSLERDVRIDGGISLSFLPTPRIAVDHVHIGNLKGGSSQDFLSVKRVRASLQLIPLLKKKIAISSLSIDDPRIYLEKLKDGRANWIFKSQSPTSSQNFEVSFDNIQINNGVLIYHTPDQDIELKDVTTNVKLNSLQGPYSISGSFKTFDQKVTLDAHAGALGETQDVDLKINANEGNLSFKGKITQAPLFIIKGQLTATGNPKKLPQNLFSEPVQFSSDVIAKENEILFSNAKCDMGAAHPTGDIKVLLKDGTQLVGNVKDLPGQAHGNFTARNTNHGLQGNLYAILPRAEDFLKWLKIDTKTLPPAFLGNIVFSTNYLFGETVRIEKLDLAIENAKLQGSLFWKPQDHFSALTFDLVSPKVENILKLLDVKTSHLQGTGKLRATVEGDATSFKATNLKGSLGSHLSFSGALAVDRTGVKPSIKAQLSLNPLKMEMLTAEQESNIPDYSEARLYFVSSKGKRERLTPHSRWSHDALDFRFLNNFDGNFELNAPHLSYGDMVLSNPKLHAILKNGHLEMKSLVGSLYGGGFHANGLITAQNALKVHMDIKGANLKKLMTQGSSIKIVGGSLSSSADLTTHGNSMHSMVNHLAGPVIISATNGVINGFDLHALSQQLASLQNPQSLMGLLNTKMGKGQTSFSSFNGNITFKEGVGVINSMNLIAQGGQGNARGSINLPAYSLDIHAEFRLTELPKLPPFHMRLYGPLDNPSRSLDTSALQTYMMENVFKSVVERLGKGKLNPGDILGSVVGPLAPQTPSVPSQDKGQGQKADKPEQIVKNIFKGLF